MVLEINYEVLGKSGVSMVYKINNCPEKIVKEIARLQKAGKVVDLDKVAMPAGAMSKLNKKLISTLQKLNANHPGDKDEQVTVTLRTKVS